jgi:hypothetical protein
MIATSTRSWTTATKYGALMNETSRAPQRNPCGRCWRNRFHVAVAFVARFQACPWHECSWDDQGLKQRFQILRSSFFLGDLLHPTAHVWPMSGGLCSWSAFGILSSQQNDGEIHWMLGWQTLPPCCGGACRRPPMRRWPKLGGDRQGMGERWSRPCSEESIIFYNYICLIIIIIIIIVIYISP